MPSYLQKIKTVEDLRVLLGPRPRTKKVIMCHGTFDIVHPGHLRHLSYAKEKADVLIASLTADAHIVKANYRPYVPEQLRATNLAALEMVDYVIVDADATPIRNILTLEPDFFAKGFEYCASGPPRQTQEEMAALDTYGGEIVFTPGDVVYSSSAIIDSHPPRIGVEKLMVLMESEEISFADLGRSLASMKGVKVFVVGDTIVDTYSHCALLGATAKSPTFSVRHERSEHYSGGAAVVAKHLQSAGAEVTFATVLGDDRWKGFVERDLSECGVRCLPVIDATRPTTHKERFITQGQKLLQVDKVDNRPISDRALRSLGESLEASAPDVVIFSDFRHGIFNRQTIDYLSQRIPPHVIKVADSQVSNRWGNILDFVGFDLLTPNEREARFALADQDSVVRPLAADLYRRASCRYLILKLGERGIISYRSPGDMPREFFTVDSFVENLQDPTGAGDALLAYAALGLATSGNIVQASILGSMAAAIACELSGNSPVSPGAVEQKLRRVAGKG